MPSKGMTKFFVEGFMRFEERRNNRHGFFEQGPDAPLHLNGVTSTP